MGPEVLSDNVKVTRNQGYDVLINNLEPTIRRFVGEHMLLGNYGEDWRSHIPENVVTGAKHLSRDPRILEKSTVEEFLEGLYFLNLKDVMTGFDNFSLAKPFVGELSRQRFIEIMYALNQHRRKIAHASANFSVIDFDDLVVLTRQLCQGEEAKQILLYLDNKTYTSATDVPADFYEDFECKNNLPSENYDLDGGFVGRKLEVDEIIKLINSDQDRIITITGAGGVGKTAIALKVAYQFLRDSNNPFDFILWFSAKSAMLTEQGILPLEPQIKGAEQLLSGILEVIDQPTAMKFLEGNVPYDSFKTFLYSQFTALKSLIIIDNLETIIGNAELLDFVKNIPRPSRVLITSRKALGEIERRYPLSDLLENDAAVLFRLVSIRRGRKDLLALSDTKVKELVKRVRCYPLLIKWSIGKVCLGKGVDDAFSEIFVGGSEIAKFSFDDVFNLMSPNGKSILYTMILWGNAPISRHPLTQIANLDDEEFEEAISDLVITSFVFTENKEIEGRLVVEFTMLTLTRGFVQMKLDQDEITKNMIQTRYYHWREEARQGEQAMSSYFQQGISFGLKTPEDYAAFTYVKAAKNAAFAYNWEEAVRNFDLAIKTSPDLQYALSEYSKYELERGHDNEALELAKRATEANPENYYAWYNLGLILLRIKKPHEAIDPLTKAKQLNPTHLPIYNDLGRAYSQCDQHDKAEAEFLAAMKEEKYPNNRHKAMTMQFMADNYRRWAEQFLNRRDTSGQLEKLQKAYKTISEAVKIPINDRRVWDVYRHVCVDYGIALWKTKGSAEGKPLLEKSIEEIRLGGSRISSPDNKIITVANYYLAALSSSDPNRDRNQLAAYLGAGLAAADPTSNYYGRLIQLKNELLGPKIAAGTRKYGTVKFYDLNRSLGVIESGNASYLFKENNFRSRLSQMQLSTLKGKTVSFVLRRSSSSKQTFVPSDIIIGT